jgi:hypothetical protein
MSGLTNGQLETLGKKMFKNNFSGVYPSDSTPHISKNNHNFSLIFNLSKHNKPGTHYVAVIKKKKKYCILIPTVKNWRILLSKII